MKMESEYIWKGIFISEKHIVQELIVCAWLND